MEGRRRPVAFLVVARDERSGYEVVYRTIHIQGLEKDIAEAITSGRMVEGCRWRKVPVRYKVAVRATGQELMCRYDPGRKAFVTEEGGVEFGVRQLKSYEEICSE